MAKRLWGCYSVVDHLEDRAFVADLLLYDRLVVPVPSSDDLQRWETQGWNPERQHRLLDILGAFAEKVEWDALLREEVSGEWEGVRHALPIRETDWWPRGGARHVEASGMFNEEGYLSGAMLSKSRRMIASKLQEKANKDGEVRGVAVYAQPDRFDRDWQVSRVPPFVRRTTRVNPGKLREAGPSIRSDSHDRAKFVVTRLVVPHDGRDDEEVLKRTVDLVSRDDVARRRGALHDLLATLHAKGLRQATVVGELEDLLADLNACVARRTRAQRARLAIQVVTTAQGAVALWAPPASLVAGPTAAAGEAAIRRRWGNAAEESVSAVVLLAEAQRALG